jgi:hypothetical protein
MIHLPPDRPSTRTISTTPFWCRPNTARTDAMTVVVGCAVTVDPEDDGSVVTVSPEDDGTS